MSQVGADEAEYHAEIAAELAHLLADPSGDVILTPLVDRVCSVNRFGLVSNLVSRATQHLAASGDFSMNPEDKQTPESPTAVRAGGPRKPYSAPRLRALGRVNVVTLNSNQEMSRKKPQG